MTESQSTTSRLLLLACLAVVAGVLLLFALDRPYDIDEKGYLQLAWQIANGDWKQGQDYVMGIQQSILPSFVSTCVHLLGDDGVFRYRVLFLLLSVAGVGIGAVVLKRHLPPRQGGFAVVFLLLLGTHASLLLYGFMVRAEPLQVFLYAATLLLADSWLREDRGHYAVLLGISLTLLVLAKFTVAPLALAVLAVCIVFSRKRLRFAALFLSGALAATVLSLWEFFSFLFPLARVLVSVLRVGFGGLPSSGNWSLQIVDHWWVWLPWIAVGLFAATRIKGTSSPLVWMTAGASLVQLAVLPLKRQVYLQDFLLPAFGLSLVVALFVGLHLRSQRSFGRIPVTSVVLILVATNLLHTREQATASRLPEQPNPFVLYHSFAACGHGDPLRFSDLRRCYGDFLAADPYGTDRYRRRQQDRLSRFFRSWTSPTDLTMSALGDNTFTRMPRGYYALLGVLLAYDPDYMLRVAGVYNAWLTPEQIAATWYCASVVTGPEGARYDYRSLLADQPITLIGVDAFLTQRITLDEAASEFLDANYLFVYDISSQSLVGVHRFLGRKLLRNWQETRLTRDPADLLVMRAIENPEQAEMLASKALESKPGHPEANFLRGRYFVGGGRGDDAVDYLVRAAEGADLKDVDAMRLAIETNRLSSSLRGRFERAVNEILQDVPAGIKPLYQRTPSSHP